MDIKMTVFDIGGTLMEYVGMPYSWIDHYETAFEEINRKLFLGLSKDDIQHSVDVFKSCNPRVNYREIEYSPEYIFSKVCADWKCQYDLHEIIYKFFGAFDLRAHIYEDTVETLERLRSNGFIIAVLTDVASGMPDELHKSYFSELMPYFDMYVSSISCGYRKPAPKGLEVISEHFGISAENMIYIGDEKKDIETAKRADCISVLIDRKGRIEDHGQDFTIRRLKELEKLMI